MELISIGRTGMPSAAESRMTETSEAQRSILRDFCLRAVAEARRHPEKFWVISELLPLKSGQHGLDFEVIAVVSRNLELRLIVEGAVPRKRSNAVALAHDRVLDRRSAKDVHVALLVPPTLSQYAKALKVTSTGEVIEDKGFLRGFGRKTIRSDFMGVTNEEIALQAVRQMNAREEDLASAKRRALEFVGLGELTMAYESLATDLQQDQTTAHPAVLRGMQMLMDGDFGDSQLVRDFINKISLWSR